MVSFFQRIKSVFTKEPSIPQIGAPVFKPSEPAPPKAVVISGTIITPTVRREVGAPVLKPSEKPLPEVGVVVLKDDEVAPTGIPKGVTIERQITKISPPPPTVVGLPPTPTEKALALGTRLPEREPRFTPSLFVSAGRRFFGADEGGPSPVQAIGILFSPFQRFFSERVGEEEIFVPQFGTVTTEEPGGFK